MGPGRRRGMRLVVAAALGFGAQYGILLPFNRAHESEADCLGLIYMAKAGYNPHEAIAVWERMEAAQGPGAWEFLSTRPSPATRRAQLTAWLPEAMLFPAVDPNMATQETVDDKSDDPDSE